MTSFTSKERLQRMEALLRRMAKRATVPNEIGVLGVRADQTEAREIVAELDAANGDAESERAMLDVVNEWKRGMEGCDIAIHYDLLRLVFTKGRELERLANVGDIVSSRDQIKRAVAQLDEHIERTLRD